ncbi:hypothetical protein GCM10027589_03660 [Actinocorallia lasiicapitis]
MEKNAGRPVGRRKVRELLGLSEREVGLALECGLLRREGRSFCAEKVAEALEDLEGFRRRLAAETRLNATEAGALLGVSAARFRTLARNAGTEVVAAAEIRKYGKVLTVRYWRAGDVEGLRAEAAAGAERLAERRRRAAERVREVAARARVRVPARDDPPERVVLRLGPTNSGKTHEAIGLLAENGRGVYCAPLRALAWEVHDRLAARVGAERVGLLTGEEERNRGAPILCCTAEAAPPTADFAVVDEAHWLADPERGHVWTRLLASGGYRVLHVTAAAEAGPLLRELLADAVRVETVIHERFSLLGERGPWTARTVPAGSAVVAFGRKTVLALHRELLDAGRRAVVLYGAMPPDVRRSQLDRFRDGEADVIVATDAIGHGVNLPLRAVAFAETVKYDGVRRRPLRLWEAAQIAGRAGRGNTDGTGETGVYSSRVPGLSADRGLVARAVAAANGSVATDLAVRRARLAPVWADLGNPTCAELPYALDGWAAAAAELPGLLEPIEVARLKARWEVVRAAVGAGPGITTRWSGSSHDLWRLLLLPVDADAPAFAPTARAVLAGADLALPRRTSRDLATAESDARYVRDLSVALRTFGPIGGLTRPDVAAAEERIVRTVVRLLVGHRSRHGLCERCGRPCPPWFPQCDSCHHDYSEVFR